MIYIRHEQQYFCNSYSSRNKCALDVETLTAILTEAKKDDLGLSLCKRLCLFSTMRLVG